MKSGPVGPVLGKESMRKQQGIRPAALGRTSPGQSTRALSSTEELISDMQAGRMVILVDDEDRENEGDLVLPAQFVTPEAINFMARYGRGLICLALTRARADELRLSLMPRSGHARHQTAFTVSIEAREGVTTGISAADRAHTIATAINPGLDHRAIATPGHIFPLIARQGGTLERAGHTEAAVDLAGLAGLVPAGVICEIMNDDGAMARLPDLLRFAACHGLKIGSIADLIAYRLQSVKLELESWLYGFAGAPGDLTPAASLIAGQRTHATSGFAS